MKEKKLFVIGGDERQYHLAMELMKQGYEIACYGMQELEMEKSVQTPETLELGMLDSNVILLPIPVLQDNLQIKSKEKEIYLKDLEAGIHKNQVLLGGKIPDSLKETCKQKGAFFVDYMELEEVSLKNAMVTAEGAIWEAMRLGKTSIQGSRCLVIGFGRCGEALAEKLSAWGADVTVMARSENARCKGNFCGYHTRDMFGKENEQEEYQLIFNTVPATVMNRDVIDSLLKGKEQRAYPIIIDISSAPGGIDFEYCRKKSVSAGLFLGIPGKYAPKTAAVIISEAVLGILDAKK